MSFNTMRAILFDSSPDRSLERESHVPIEEDDDAISKVTHNVPLDIYGQEQQYTNYQPQQQQHQQQQHQQHQHQHQHQQQQHGLPNMLQTPQLEFVGHNISYAPNLYYGEMMAAYYPHSVAPRFVEAPPKMLLAHEVTREPVYVNAKQYHAIQRRRESRAKAEQERKLIKERKPYLHESRHQHALKRVRSTCGRFAKRAEVDTLKNTTSGSGVASGSGAASGSAQTSKRVRSESVETPRGGSVNLHDYQASSGHHFSLDIGKEW